MTPTFHGAGRAPVRPAAVAAPVIGAGMGGAGMGGAGMGERIKVAVVAACSILAIGFGAALGAATAPCPTEDSGVVCTWDAPRRGNGQGDSFTRILGWVIYW